jgi:hypothetical protein
MMEHARAAAVASESGLDLLQAAQLIRAGRAAPEMMERWLAATWRDPLRFRRALYVAGASSKTGAIKSRPELGLDLYTDCVAVHLGRSRTALIVMQDGRPSEITFETLHARCSALASLWIKAGVKTGDSLAVLLPVGADYCVALLAGLRLGLMLTPVAPLGATYARARLALVAAKHVATVERWAYMLPADAPNPLPVAAHSGDTTLTASHTYAPDATVLRLLSPQGTGDQEAPAELDALMLHEALLRDSLLVFALQAGDRVAAPGWDAQQLQPLALLSVFLAGATWVECTPEEIAAQPELIVQTGINVLGVNARLREQLRAAGPETCKGVRAWFRSLSDVFDHDKWRSFSELLAQREIGAFCVLYNAASGGAHLFSPRTMRDHSGRIWPAPGRTFLIAQVGASLLPALDETGVYTPLRDDEADPSIVRMVLAKLDQGWTLGGSIDPGHEGRKVPVDEIAACAEQHPQVGAASVVVLPGRWPNAAHVLLLLFVREPADASGELPAEIKAIIQRELGQRHMPERVEVFALHPRFAGEALRPNWCASQYASGMLGRKSRTPMFLTLSRLAWIFASHRPTT